MLHVGCTCYLQVVHVTCGLYRLPVGCTSYLQVVHVTCGLYMLRIWHVMIHVSMCCFVVDTVFFSTLVFGINIFIYLHIYPSF